MYNSTALNSDNNAPSCFFFTRSVQQSLKKASGEFVNKKSQLGLNNFAIRSNSLGCLS